MLNWNWITGEIHVEVEGDLVQQAQNQPLDRERVDRQMRKTGGMSHSVSGILRSG